MHLVQYRVYYDSASDKRSRNLSTLNEIVYEIPRVRRASRVHFDIFRPVKVCNSQILCILNLSECKVLN